MCRMELSLPNNRQQSTRYNRYSPFIMLPPASYEPVRILIKSCVMKIFLIILSILLTFNCYSQKATSSFVLHGDISGIRGTAVTIYYNYSVNGRNIQDSVKVKDGKFTIRGKISEPV